MREMPWYFRWLPWIGWELCHLSYSEISFRRISSRAELAQTSPKEQP